MHVLGGTLTPEQYFAGVFGVLVSVAAMEYLWLGVISQKLQVYKGYMESVDVSSARKKVVAIWYTLLLALIIPTFVCDTAVQAVSLGMTLGLLVFGSCNATLLAFTNGKYTYAMAVTDVLYGMTDYAVSFFVAYGVQRGLSAD